MKTILRGAGLPATLILLFSLGITVRFLPRQVSWANAGSDGGDYLAAVLTGGIPHPSGYPTYILLNMLFQEIPIATPYWRGAFFSACMAALSSALLYIWLVRQFGGCQPAPRDHWAAAVGSLAWAVSPFLISQALIVDVHSLHAVFLILGLFWIDALSRPPVAKQFASLNTALLPFLFGVGSGNHLTLIFLLPAALLAACASTPRARLPGRLAGQAAALFLGLLVYVYLPWSAARFPPVNWGNPQTLAGFAWLVSGAAYHGMLLHLQPAEVLPRFVEGGRFLLRQFGLLGLALGGYGALRRGIFPKTISWSLSWCALISGLFALTYAAVDWTTYLLPVLLAWCAWTGAAAASLWSWRVRGLPLGGLVTLLCLAWMFAQLPATLRRSDPRAETAAADYAQSLLAQAPPRAVILTSQDLDTFPLWYYHSGLKQRPDLHVVLAPLTDFGWYRETIQHTYPDLVLPRGDAPGDVGWENLLLQANPGLPVCRTSVYTLPKPGVTFTCSP